MAHHRRRPPPTWSVREAGGDHGDGGDGDRRSSRPGGAPGGPPSSRAIRTRLHPDPPPGSAPDAPPCSLNARDRRARGASRRRRLLNHGLRLAATGLVFPRDTIHTPPIGAGGSAHEFRWRSADLRRHSPGAANEAPRAGGASADRRGSLHRVGAPGPITRRRGHRGHPLVDGRPMPPSGREYRQGGGRHRGWQTDRRLSRREVGEGSGLGRRCSLYPGPRLRTGRSALFGGRDADRASGGLHDERLLASVVGAPRLAACGGL